MIPHALLPLLLVLTPSTPALTLESGAQALSNDGRLFAFAVSDGTLHIVTLPEGKPVVVATGFGTIVEGLDFSPDGKQLASVAGDGRIRIVACVDGRLLGELPGVATANRPRTIDFVDDGNKLLIARGQPKAQLVQRENGKQVGEYQLDPDKAITARAVSADGAHFALGDEGGHLAVYSSQSGAIEFGPALVPGKVHSLDFDPRAERLAVGAGDCRARVYTLKSKGKPLEFSHCDQDLTGDLAIGSVRFSSDGRKLLTTSFTWWEVRLWDIESGSGIWRFEFDAGNPIPLVASFAKDSTVVISSADTNQLSWGKMLDLADGKRLHGFGEGVGDGSYFYCTGGDYAWFASPSKITILEPRTGKPVCELPLSSR